MSEGRGLGTWVISMLLSVLGRWRGEAGLVLVRGDGEVCLGVGDWREAEGEAGGGKGL